jgi:[protein-PII] uridylyltransferase
LTSPRLAFAKSLLPLLWDAGLRVGHAVRSVAECVELARTDLHARNAMSEARLVTGDVELFHRFAAEMRASVYTDARANRAFAEAMRSELAERRAKYGSLVGTLEPNVKECAGGLRDLHTVGWVGLARHGLLHLDALVRAGLLTPAEHRHALRASDVLLRVRNELHFQSGRTLDVLTLELQPATAVSLGYTDRHFASAAELFMRDLYHRGEELLRVTDAFLVRADFWSPTSRRFPLRWKGPRATGPGRRYRIRAGQLYVGPGTDSAPGGDPIRLLEVFREAQRHGVGLSPELREQVRSRLGAMDRAARESREAAAIFLEILRDTRSVGRTLRAMHESGLLCRYLPEFRRVTLMVQHDHVHQYTVDEHTLRVLEGLDRLSTTREENLAVLRGALEAVEDRAVLSLGCLLHDIGKGRGAGTGHASRGAAIARRVCRRLGLADRKLEDVAFLVQKHLVMARTSQRRDLADEAVIQGFAETVETESRLHMLYVLTHVDISGVGPGSWNEWKGTLLTELYLKTLPRVSGPSWVPPVPHTRLAIEERVLRELAPEVLRSDVEEFLSHLPARYARVVAPDVIASHFQLVRTLGTRAVATEWLHSKRVPYSVLTVCAPDAPGLLALLSGALTGSGLDILSVDVFTRDDGVALDVFRVTEAMGAGSVQPVPDALRTRVTAQLEAAFAGELDVAAAVERQRVRQRRRRKGRGSRGPAVRFEPLDTLGRTPIEVRADDEPGLLYRIASTLAALGLDISAAKAATEKNQALDVFYVESAAGGPVPEERHQEIRLALLQALEGTSTVRPQRRGARPGPSSDA